MTQRPILNKHLHHETFRSYYYLKEELLSFCKEHKLPTSGSKIELTNRIAYYLETGNIQPSIKKGIVKAKQQSDIDETTLIEDHFVCSQKHREFFESRIGKGFSFPVAFQTWLKQNTGKTYQDAILAYYQIREEKKTKKTVIDRQFEYNTYIRDFFEHNKGLSLQDAITCWKHKKQLPGHNRYEQGDLNILHKT